MEFTHRDSGQAEDEQHVISSRLSNADPGPVAQISHNWFEPTRDLSTSPSILTLSVTLYPA